MFNALAQVCLADICRRLEDHMPRILRYRLQRSEINLALSRRKMIVPTLRVSDVKSERLKVGG